MPRSPEKTYKVTIGDDVQFVEACDECEARQKVTGGSVHQPKQFSVELSSKEAMKQEVDLREVVETTEKPKPARKRSKPETPAKPEPSPESE